MKAFTSGKPRVLRHRQAPLPAPFSQLKGAAGSNAMEEQVSELPFPQSLSPALWDALSYFRSSNLWKNHRNFFAET